MKKGQLKKGFFQRDKKEKKGSVLEQGTRKKQKQKS